MRLKFIIPAAIMLAVFLAVNAFFLSSMVKGAMIENGEMIFGAKVEIAEVKVDLSRLTFRVKGLAVADRGNPWRNLFEIGDVRFAMEPLPLLSKKVVIDEAAVEGLKWDTGRKTSGALPPAREKKYRELQQKDSLFSKLLAGMIRKGKARLNEIPLLSTIDAIRDLPADRLVHIGDLKSLDSMDQWYGDMQSKAEQLETKVAAVKTGELLDESDAAVKDASELKIKSLRDVETARLKIKRAKQAWDELHKTVDEVKAIHAQFKSEMGEREEILKRIKDLKEKDKYSIQAGLNIPPLSFEEVAGDCLGPVWMERVSHGLKYMEAARRYLPPPRKKSPPVQPRLKGVDVNFPHPQSPPDLLIKKISLSGTTGGPGKEGEALDFTGTVTDVTTQPALVGRPIRIRIRGAKGGRMLAIDGTLDHTRGTPEENVGITYTGISFKDLQLGSMEWMPPMEKSRLKLTGGFRMRGRVLDCSLDLAAQQIQWAPREVSVSSCGIAQVLGEIWPRIPQIMMQARISGPLEDLKFDLSTNLDDEFSKRMKALYGAKMAEIEAKIDAEINRRTAEAEARIVKRYDESRGKVQAKCGEYEEKLRKKEDELKALIDAKEKEIRHWLDAEKRKTEDKLKNLL
ncbi:MAG: TIGR03545 family protein [Bacillota bacterium]